MQLVVAAATLALCLSPRKGKHVYTKVCLGVLLAALFIIAKIEKVQICKLMSD